MINNSIDYDLIGVGFGPSNLALGVALEDAHSPLRRTFLEQKPIFSWHPGMQMEGTSMQTPFLEDLVTRHNPCSAFTFLSYLKSKGRLTDFADLREFFPSRHEFNDYFMWAADKIGRSVHFNTHVTSIVPVFGEDLGIDALAVSVRNVKTGIEDVVRGHNVVLGLGYTPIVPSTSEPLSGDGRVFHSINTLPSLQAKFSSREVPYSFVVAGAGQSAAEIALHLLRQYRNARVTVVSRGFVFRAKDSNAFVSAFYTGDAADQFFELEDESRRILLETLDESNYSAADADLLRELAKFIYADRVEGRRRLELRSYSELRDIEETHSMVRLTCWSDLSKRQDIIEADGVCLATGFGDDGLKGALRHVNGFLKQTSAGAYCVSRDYRIEAEAGFRPGIYVQGYARNYHGCTEGTISDLPHRAQRIIESIHDRCFASADIREAVGESVA